MRDKQSSEDGLQMTQQEIVNEIFTPRTGIIVGQSRHSKHQRSSQSSNTIHRGKEDDLQKIVDEQKAELMAAQARIDAQHAELERTKAKIDLMYEHYVEGLQSNKK